MRSMKRSFQVENLSSIPDKCEGDCDDQDVLLYSCPSRKRMRRELGSTDSTTPCSSSSSYCTLDVHEKAIFPSLQAADCLSVSPNAALVSPNSSTVIQEHLLTLASPSLHYPSSEELAEEAPSIRPLGDSDCDLPATAALEHFMLAPRQSDGGYSHSFEEQGEDDLPSFALSWASFCHEERKVSSTFHDEQAENLHPCDSAGNHLSLRVSITTGAPTSISELTRNEMLRSSKKLKPRTKLGRPKGFPLRAKVSKVHPIEPALEPGNISVSQIVDAFARM